MCRGGGVCVDMALALQLYCTGTCHSPVAGTCVQVCLACRLTVLQRAWNRSTAHCRWLGSQSCTQRSMPSCRCCTRKASPPSWSPMPSSLMPSSRFFFFLFCMVSNINTRSACGLFCVSIIHQTLTWTTGSLTCVCDLFRCMRIHMGGLWFIVSSEGLKVAADRYVCVAVKRMLT